MHRNTLLQDCVGTNLGDAMSYMDKIKYISEPVSTSLYQYTSILHGATTHVDTTRMVTQHTTYGDTTRMVTQHTTYGDTTRMVRTRGGGRGQREAATLTLID